MILAESQMAKEKTTTKEVPETKIAGAADKAVVKVSSKKKITSGVLNIQATFNNTIVTLSDKQGNALCTSSSGALGFCGTKKGTPFAASKVGEFLGEKAIALGMKDADIVVRGIGPGRESVIRTFMGRGVEINSIKDSTPVPHNGPKQKKPRRV